MSAPRLPSSPNRRKWNLLILFGLWLAIYAASLASPPLLDDADATHAQAAQAMLRTGDLVTLHVDGVRYLEKPPLPYWITAASLRLFASGSHFVQDAAFAVHLPLALTVLALAWLGLAWSRRAWAAWPWAEDAAFYSALFVLTSAGTFLFTRVFIPDALLSLLLGLCLYAAVRALDQPEPNRSLLWPALFWLALALAVLAKGLVALVFAFGALLGLLLLGGELRHLRRLRPLSGLLLLLAVAAPWHILAGLRNTGGADGHGFFWFYFINEHLLRFLGRRIPRDYNKLPGYLYWSLHIVWLFPWSLFAPAALLAAWQRRKQLRSLPANSLARRSLLSLVVFSALVLVFFSLSTNQEYYTFPVYLPLLMLLAAALAAAQSTAPHAPADRRLAAALRFGFAAFTVLGAVIAALLGYGLYSSRHLPFVPEIGSLLAHRDVGGYTLSMSHFFDLTGPSFAALRLPATIALLAFALGPAIAWSLWRRRGLRPALLAVAFTSAVFLVAAHLALIRFGTMLSSQNFAVEIDHLQRSGRIAPDSEVLLFGDQAFGSSIPFYLQQRVDLVDGRSTSMLFGSTFPDAPPIFLTAAQLRAQWGHGPRKLLFVPPDLPAAEQAQAAAVLGPHPILLLETAGKDLYTDRPLP